MSAEQQGRVVINNYATPGGLIGSGSWGLGSYSFGSLRYGSPIVTSPPLYSSQQRHSPYIKGIWGGSPSFGSGSPYHRHENIPPELALGGSGSGRTTPLAPRTEISASTTDSSPLMPADACRILDGYLIAQMVNVVCVAVWWVYYGPVVLNLFNGNPWGIALGKTLFDVALIIGAPLAGATSHRVPIRDIIPRALAVRVLVYGVLAPLVWVIVQSGWVIDPNNTDLTHLYIQGFFFPIMCLDGVAVAFSNALDLDGQGLDILGAQYHFTVSSKIKISLFQSYEKVFWVACIFLAPGFSFMCYYLSSSYLSLLLLSVGVFFSIDFALSTWLLRSRLPLIHDVSADVEEYAMRDDILDFLLCLGDGLKVCWKTPKLFSQLCWMAAERVGSDSMALLIIPIYNFGGIHGETASASFNAIFSVLMIATGKLGEALGATLLRSFLEQNSLTFSVFSCLSGLVTLAFPLSYLTASQRNDANTNPVRVLTHLFGFLASFFFFLCVTPSKMNSLAQLQQLVPSQYAEHVFGFMSVFLLVADALFVCLLAVLFTSVPVHAALWTVTGFFCFAGIANFVQQVMRDPQQQQQQQAHMQAQSDNDEDDLHSNASLPFRVGQRHTDANDHTNDDLDDDDRSSHTLSLLASQHH